MAVDVAADFSGDGESGAVWLGAGDASWRGGLDEVLRECDARAPLVLDAD